MLKTVVEPTTQAHMFRFKMVNSGYFRLGVMLNFVFEFLLSASHLKYKH